MRKRETQAYDNGRRNDANWHGVWFVRTAVLENGWSAEFAIPFKTLRFPARADQEWGLNVVRIVRRINERSTWSPVPRQFSHYNVAYAGTLDGVRGVQPGATSGSNRSRRPTSNTAARRADWEPSADGGVDLKWGITSPLVLDGTWRTDFSQVETDAQQINLTRFTPFFPEKREFFLESPASFQIGLVESDGDDSGATWCPSSAAVSASQAAQPIPVIGGVRVTGRAGAQGVGFLTMQTDDFEARPGDNFTARRLTRPVSGTTTSAAFYFGRESTGTSASIASADSTSASRQNEPSRSKRSRCTTTANEPGDWAGRTGFRLDGNAPPGPGRASSTSATLPPRSWLRPAPRHRHAVRALCAHPRPGRQQRRDPRAPSAPDHRQHDRRRLRSPPHANRQSGYGIAFADGGQFTASVNGTFERLDEASTSAR